MANRQFNQSIQSDIRPLQSDIRFLVLIPIHPTGLHQVRLPGFSGNQFKVLIGSLFSYGWSSRLGSALTTATGSGPGRPASVTGVCFLPPAERRRLLLVNISDTGNDFSSIYQGTNSLWYNVTAHSEKDRNAWRDWTLYNGGKKRKRMKKKKSSLLFIQSHF